MKFAEPLEGNNNQADIVDLDQLYRVAPVRNVSIWRDSHRDSARSYASPLVAGVAVATAHAATFLLLLHGWRLPLLQGADGEVSRQTIVSFIERARTHDSVALPEMHLLSPTVDQTITNVSFEDPDADLVPGIIGPASAPQPDPAVVVDPTPFALRAGLNTGESVTVILTFEVLVDGSVGQVTVVTGTGSSLIDAAAMDYARSLRWIPATTNRRATVRRINFPVTLALS
jgi:TonB family protein